MERNGTLVGNTLAGLGKGLLAADDAGQAYQKRAEIVRANYGGTGTARTGLLTAGTTATSGSNPSLMTPQQRFSAEGVQGRYVYDRASGRYLLVPTDQQQPMA